MEPGDRGCKSCRSDHFHSRGSGRVGHGGSADLASWLRAFNHGGPTFGFSTSRYPAAGLAVMVLPNRDDQVGTRLVEKVASLFAGWKTGSLVAQQPGHRYWGRIGHPGLSPGRAVGCQHVREGPKPVELGAVAESRVWRAGFASGINAKPIHLTHCQLSTTAEPKRS